MSNTIVQFFVPGIPKPGGSKRGIPFQRKGGGLGVRVIDSGGQSTKDWRACVALAAHEAMGERPVHNGPCCVEVEFVMPRPRFHFNKRGELLDRFADVRHMKKPDATKLWRSTEDALTGIVYEKDEFIDWQQVSKRYADEGKPSGAWIKVMRDWL